MGEKYAILLDGGFVTAKLKAHLGRFPLSTDVVTLCAKLQSRAELSDLKLLRIYYYDAPPLNKVIVNPLNSERLDLGKTSRASEARRLQESLDLEPNFAVRRGETVFHGWRLGAAATQELQNRPRSPVAKDFVPDIKQKGVDLRIGLDIARLSLRRLVDVIVVVAGDSDLVPAFKFARREGIRVYLDYLGHSVARDLRVHVDLIFDESGESKTKIP
jgi:uncharacterized LabA/DUF88 family protein